jgi:D-glycero-alpha-D-manno-heptose 1-phosphate guanylyltransferase
MVNEAIILAGGLGTRLQRVLEGLPKAMAPVRGRPFLEYLLDHLVDSGLTHVILSTGHLSDIIQDHFGDKYHDIKISYSREEKPLGTGGAIVLAGKMVQNEQYFVMNGDTLFRIDMSKMYFMHRDKKADITIALRKVEDVSRYGYINMDAKGRIFSFSEKEKEKRGGWINGGIYLMNKTLISNAELPVIFSLEKDLFPSLLGDHDVYGYTEDAYFIDIGTPEDYERAQHEL